MSTMHSAPSAQFLGPHDLRIAADAFEAALTALGESWERMEPYAARHILARAIMERTLAGERDAHVLCQGALARLGSASRQ